MFLQLVADLPDDTPFAQKVTLVAAVLHAEVDWDDVGVDVVEEGGRGP